MASDVINQLYLELSQIATVQTENDAQLEKLNVAYIRRSKLLADIFNCDEFEQLPVKLRKRISAEFN